jgi:hypothetical protein
MGELRCANLMSFDLEGNDLGAPKPNHEVCHREFVKRRVFLDDMFDSRFDIITPPEPSPFGALWVIRPVDLAGIPDTYAGFQFLPPVDIIYSHGPLRAGSQRQVFFSAIIVPVILEIINNR